MYMIDYDRIIKPLNSDNRGGVDLREDSNLSEFYFNLKSLRSSLRREERRRIEIDGTLTTSNSGWQEVISLASNILINHSKDVEVAIWLLEGLTRVEGIQGLKIGLDILYYFLKEYEIRELNPKINNEDEDDGIDNILLPIVMLSGRYEVGTIIAPIYFCCLIQTLDGNSYSGWELKKILQSANPNQLNHEVTKENLLGSDTMQAILSTINFEKFLQLQNTLEQGIESFKKLNSLLTERFERNAPNLDNLGNVLKYCHSLMTNIAMIVKNDKEEFCAQEIGASIEQLGKSNTNFELNNLDHTNIDKEQALQLLEMLVKFFRAIESHSPVSYLLSRALNWSKLSLPEILCDIIPDDAMRTEYCKFSGVPFLYKDDN